MAYAVFVSMQCLKNWAIFGCEVLEEQGNFWFCDTWIYLVKNKAIFVIAMLEELSNFY